MKLQRLLFIGAAMAFFGSSAALAAPAADEMTLKTDFKIWMVSLRRQDFFSEETRTTFRGIPVSIPEPDRTAVADFIAEETALVPDVIKIREYLKAKVADDIYREKEDVTIGLDLDGRPVFTGAGLYGRQLDAVRASFAVKKALEEGVAYVHLPLIRQEPVVTADPQLKKRGIAELVASGETDFRGSPANRTNNIQVGIARFNGQMLAPDAEFSFDKILGRVDETTGYKKELVIAGDRTIPEYGGGLCQVSTTAFRAALAGGFPITERKNHSYTVSYYAPIGLDATVYPPQVDFKFVNDSGAYLVMQSFTRDGRAYYNFYGTGDGRKTHLIGPYYYDEKSPPPPRTEVSSKLAPGEEEVLGHAVRGISSSWYRHVTYKDPQKEPSFDSIHSKYQARPDFRAVGADQ